MGSNMVPTMTTVPTSAASVRGKAGSGFPFVLSYGTPPYQLIEILEMQLTVALFNQGGICQEMLAQEQMEIGEFLLVHERIVEIQERRRKIGG